MRSLVSLIIVGGLANTTRAAPPPPAPLAPPPPAPPRQISAAVGGFALYSSRLYFGKLSWEPSRWAISLDLVRDSVAPDWAEDGSRGDYVAWAGGVSGRYYARAPGRGFYGEVGALAASLSLTVTDATGEARQRAGSTFVATLGAGYRLGFLRDRAFVELGWRSGTVLKGYDLYTDDVAPPGRTKESVTYHAWYGELGSVSSQFIIALGWSFRL